MEQLIDILSTVYHLHHSYEQFKRNHENTPAAKVCCHTIFETALNPSGIRRCVQHTEDALFQYESNGVSYAQFQRIQLFYPSCSASNSAVRFSLPYDAVQSVDN